MKYLSRSWLKQNRNLSLLIGLILIESILVSHFWIQARRRVPFGFLVKSGQSYLLIWKVDDQNFRSVAYYSLPLAVAYAHTELGLDTGHNPFMADELERSWTQDRGGAVVMFWKTSRLDNLNQLTFHHRADANFFLKAFRAGHYSTSPFGHSIFLSPSSFE